MDLLLLSICSRGCSWMRNICQKATASMERPPLTTYFASVRRSGGAASARSAPPDPGILTRPRTAICLVSAATASLCPAPSPLFQPFHPRPRAGRALPPVLHKTRKKSRTTSLALHAGHARQSGCPETNPFRIRDFLPLSCGRFGFLYDAILPYKGQGMQLKNSRVILIEIPF
jgi:hypothetical protein